MELIVSFSPPLLFNDGLLRQGNLSMLPSAFDFTREKMSKSLTVLERYTCP